MTKVLLLGIKKIKNNTNSDFIKYELRIKIADKETINKIVKIYHSPFKCIDSGDLELLVRRPLFSLLIKYIDKFDEGVSLKFPINIEL